MPEYPTIEACIGNTPLVRLQRLPGNTSNTILAKLEGNNPAGSVKDRPVLSMIAQAEARGEPNRSTAAHLSPHQWDARAVTSVVASSRSAFANVTRA